MVWLPFYCVGCKFIWLFVQVFGDLCVVSYCIDTLVLKMNEILISTLLHHPFLFKGKTNASSRSSWKNFWRRCRGNLRQVKPYQVSIINSHLLHYIILHSPLVFLSPTSKMIFEKFMDPHPLANLFKISNYDEPIASELCALDYLYEVLLGIRESENCDEKM